MPITFSDLKKSVMDAVGEDSLSPTYWTSAADIEIEDYLNDAVEEIYLTSPIYTEELHIPLFANRRHYYIDPGKGGQFLFLKNVRVLPEGYDLTMVDPISLSRDDYLWITRTGTPRSFYQIGDNIIRPVPFPDKDGQSLECLASIIPPRYTYDDEVIDLPDSLVEACVSYAVYTLLLSMKRPDKAMVWFNAYAKFLGLASIHGSKLIARAGMLKSITETDVSK